MCEVCNNTGIVDMLIGDVTFPAACSACCVTEPEPPKKPEPVCKTDEKGNREWTLNGQLHRADGPAVEKANGDKEWWVEDKRHRADGPAVEWADGYKAWYLNGKEVTEKDVMKRAGRVK